MAVRDIIWYIAKEQDRVFLIRVSFVEIYKEEFRDLLVSGNADNVIIIREDPQQGLFVKSNENFVTDFESLLGTFFEGENKRSVVITAMDERSSRSRSILRITTERKKRSTKSKDSKTESDSDDENDWSKENLARKMMEQCVYQHWILLILQDWRVLGMQG